MLTNAVFVGLVTLICSLSCATEVCRPRSSMTGWSTDCVVVSAGYDLIWLMMYELPLFCSDEFAVPSDESLYVANNWDVVVYSTGDIAVIVMTAPSTTRKVMIIVMTCLRMMSKKADSVMPSFSCFAPAPAWPGACCSTIFSAIEVYSHLRPCRTERPSQHGTRLPVLSP